MDGVDEVDARIVCGILPFMCPKMLFNCTWILVLLLSMGVHRRRRFFSALPVMSATIHADGLDVVFRSGQRALTPPAISSCATSRAVRLHRRNCR